MIQFKRRFIRSISVSILFVLLSFLIGAYTTVAYADQITLENQADSYTVNDNAVSTEQLQEQPQKALESTSDIAITGYEELKVVVLSANEQIPDLNSLKKSGKLPQKAIVYASDNAAIEVKIFDWQGSFDGRQAGRYAITAVWQLPDGYVKQEELGELTIDVVVAAPQSIPAADGTNSETVVNDSNSEDLYTVVGSEGNDAIEIVSLDGGIIRITVTSDNGTYIYNLSNKKKISVDAKDGDDTIYFNLTGKSSGLTNLVVLGGAGNDTITTGLTAGHAIDLSGTDILLKAEKVLFDIAAQNNQALKLKAKNMTINAAPTEASKFYESQNIKVVFRNVDFEITGNLTVDATSYISNGQEVENGSGESTVYEIDIQDENSESGNIVDTVVDTITDKQDR